LHYSHGAQTKTSRKIRNNQTCEIDTWADAGHLVYTLINVNNSVEKDCLEMETEKEIFLVLN
jgi:hypothetical protein